VSAARVLSCGVSRRGRLQLKFRARLRGLNAPRTLRPGHCVARRPPMSAPMPWATPMRVEAPLLRRGVLPQAYTRLLGTRGIATSHACCNLAQSCRWIRTKIGGLTRSSAISFCFHVKDNFGLKNINIIIVRAIITETAERLTLRSHDECTPTKHQALPPPSQHSSRGAVNFTATQLSEADDSVR